jgi:hypothetical protein
LSLTARPSLRLSERCADRPRAAERPSITGPKGTHVAVRPRKPRRARRHNQGWGGKAETACLWAVARDDRFAKPPRSVRCACPTFPSRPKPSPGDAARSIRSAFAAVSAESSQLSAKRPAPPSFGGVAQGRRCAGRWASQILGPARTGVAGPAGPSSSSARGPSTGRPADPPRPAAPFSGCIEDRPSVLAAAAGA